MKVFYAFLIILCDVILWMLPITTMVYDFRTDVEKDTFSVTTAVGVTTSNVTLSESLYDDDTDTISFTSNATGEVPLVSTWNGTTRELAVSSLAAGTTRSLVVSYDIDALNAAAAINTLLDKSALIYYLIIIGFPIAGVAAIFINRA